MPDSAPQLILVRPAASGTRLVYAQASAELVAGLGIFAATV
ncbi:hypothetical protein [Amycolatopsis silviterrae]|uniref:Uncharacterized protein n=1 Tax=Amycolatopsis silviterrae TaxID=1656914 RepID=A0ABW5H866_9PSEU